LAHQRILVSGIRVSSGWTRVGNREPGGPRA
jgi:hypothetical protein